jgi:hypothetical protein
MIKYVHIPGRWDDDKYDELRYCFEHNIPWSHIRISGITRQRLLEFAKTHQCVNDYYHNKVSFNDIIRTLLDLCE